MDFGVYLVRSGLITADDYVDAREAQSSACRRLGELRISSHKLTMRQVMDVLDAQFDTEKPFGQLAIDKGYLTQGDLIELLGLQIKLCPSLSDIIVERQILDEDTVREEARRFHNDILEDSIVAQES